MRRTNHKSGRDWKAPKLLAEFATIAIVAVIITYAILAESYNIGTGRNATNNKYLESNLNASAVKDYLPGLNYTAIAVNNIAELSNGLSNNSYTALSESAFDITQPSANTTYPATIVSLIFLTNGPMSAEQLLESQMDLGGTESQSSLAPLANYTYAYGNYKVSISTAEVILTLRSQPLNSTTVYPIRQVISAFTFNNIEVSVTTQGYANISAVFSQEFAERIFQNIVG